MKRLLDSIIKYFPRQFVIPRNKCVGLRHPRESDVWLACAKVRSVFVCSNTEIIAIGVSNTIELWNINTLKRKKQDEVC